MDTNANPDYAIIDRAGISGFLFFPRPDHSKTPPGATDYLIEVESEVRVSARFYAFDTAAPTILYYHGNGEVVADHDGIAPFYQDAGANLFVVDFRGYGASSGRPTFASLVTDAHAVAQEFHRLLDDQGYSEKRYVMGRSLGSHPALEIAARLPEHFHGLLIESGAANLRRLAEMAGLDASSGQGRTLVEAHEAKIRSIQLPALILHGENDELIPLAHAAELHDLLTHRGAPELEIIPGAGHNDILWIGQEQYFTAIASFIART